MGVGWFTGTTCVNEYWFTLKSFQVKTLPLLNIKAVSALSHSDKLPKVEGVN